MVECGGLPFRRGQPVLRFENHVFFKQWGCVRKSETGRTLDGKTYDEFPAMPRIGVATAAERTDLLATIYAD